MKTLNEYGTCVCQGQLNHINPSIGPVSRCKTGLDCFWKKKYDVIGELLESTNVFEVKGVFSIRAF